jgi:DNA-binding transcriptional LysR family regulator
MRLDLTDLRLFLCIAETASITHGAARANMALASASERIRGMEAALGVALLTRKRRGVELTPAGQALAHHARLVRQQVEHMRSDLSKYAKGLRGHIRLLANASAISELLPERLNRFLAEHSGIDIDIEEKPSYQIVRSVAEGLADIGVVADIVDFGGLEATPFASDRLVLIAPRGHALARGRSWFFHDVLDYEFVGMVTTNALQQYLSEQALQSGKLLTLRVRLNSFDAIGRMVESGIGIAIIPETAADRCRRTMALRVMRLRDAWSLRHLHLCVRKEAELPSHARKLLHFLRQDGDVQASATGARTTPWRSR